MKQEIKKDISEVLNSYLYDSPKEDDVYGKQYIGQVLDNKDPEKIGRCKIRIHGLHDELLPEELPWSIPEFSLNFSSKGSFMVPEIGTLVYVKFDDGDIYEPIYSGKVLDREHLDFESDYQEDYPDSVILYETKNGDYLKVNRFKGEFSLKTAAGVLMKFSENGDIELTNESSENGDAKINIKGNFSIDDKLGNFSLATQQHMTSAFSDVTLISNGSVTTKSLDDISFETNREFNVMTGDRTVIKSRTENRQESIENNIIANTVNILPATIETKTYDVEDNEKTIPQAFTVSIGNDPNKVIFMSVVPDPNGGPFNCLPFDPLLGIPHQGRLVTGALNAIGFAKDSIENEIQINKMKAQVEAKYIRTSASYVEMIAKKYSSIDSQAQILAATLTNNSIILEQKAKDLELGLSKIQEQKEKELENIELKFGNFMKEPIFGTVSSGYEKNRIDYEKKLSEAEVKAKLDMTGKTTAKDIAGPGNGLIGV